MWKDQAKKGACVWGARNSFYMPGHYARKALHASPNRLPSPRALDRLEPQQFKSGAIPRMHHSSCLDYLDLTLVQTKLYVTKTSVHTYLEP